MDNASRSYRRMVTQTNTTIGGTGSHSQLWGVNVCTSAASAVITIKETDTNGATIATIDASAKGTYNFWGIRAQNGLYVAQTGGNSDFTVTYS